jgi:hypothetical protein
LTVEILRDVAFTIFDYSKIKVKDLDRGKRDSANKFWIITTTVVAVAALFTIQNPDLTSNTRETTHEVVIRHDKTHGNNQAYRRLTKNNRILGQSDRFESKPLVNA